MKKQIVMIGIVILLLTTWLSGCQSHGIGVHKISEVPTNYVNMTEEQMNIFPHLKEAILTNKLIDASQEEMNRLRDFLDSFETEIVQYQNEFYEVGFWYAD